MGGKPNKLSNPSLQRWVGCFFVGLGLLLILSSFNGGWGAAYGQTVVTPTPGLVVGDPQLSKTGNPSCCSAGDEVVYTIVATNVGGSDVTNVVIADTVPAELELKDVTTSKGTVTIQGNYFEVHIGTIAPGEIVTIVATAVIREGIPDDTIVTNTAYLRSDQGDRQASSQIVIKGNCTPPPILPPTGGLVPQAEGGVSLWFLLAGLCLLLLGIVLTLGARRKAAVEV